MLGIVPLCLESGEGFWSDGRGLGLVRDWFRRVAAFSCLDSLVAVGSDPVLLEAARQAGIETVPCLMNGVESLPFLAPGTGSALLELSRRGAVSGPVAVLNFRNPFIEEGELARGMESLGPDGSALVASAIDVEDHPCQLKTYYRVVGSGLAVVFEDPEVARDFLAGSGLGAGSGLAVGRPMPLDWVGRGQTGPAGPYRRQAREGRCDYSPYPPHGESSGELWWKVDDATARFLHSGPSGDVLAASPAGTGAGLRLVRRDSRIWLEMDEPFSNGSGVVGLMPCRDGTALPEAALELDFRPGCKAAPLPREFSPDGSDCLLFAVLEIVDGGAYDFWDKYDAAPTLCVHDNAESNPIAPDGRVITGRQDFPRVMMPDGSFVLVDGGAKEPLPRLAGEGGMRTVALSGSRTFDVAKPLELCSLELALEER